MSIAKLAAENFRILKNIEIEPSASLNIISGANGSGKTSLLEAIFFLSTAKSFRKGHISELIHHQANSVVVFSHLKNASSHTVLGIKRSRNEILMKANGRPIKQVSELAKWLPVQVIHPESHELITGAGRIRRQFVDWGVFHVEQGFYPVWLRYQRALKQRNASLKQNKIVMDGIWDKELSKMAVQIHKMREAYLDKLKSILSRYTQAIFEQSCIEFIYQPGWNVSKDLASQLYDNQVKDRQRGFTSLGPHRADLVFKVHGHKVQKEISRGQQKMLVASLRLAQAELYSAVMKQSCVVLVDDFASELDSHYRHLLMQWLSKINAQLFLTNIKSNIEKGIDDNKKNVFHVERGQVKQVL